MDDMQVRFLTTQSLYGKDLQERSIAIRQLRQGDLTPADIATISIRLELALSCQDEYVRSAAAMLLAGLAEQIPTSPTMASGLLALSYSAEAFPREAALRTIKRIHEHGCCLKSQDAEALNQRLEEARHSEAEAFVLGLFDEE